MRLFLTTAPLCLAVLGLALQVDAASAQSSPEPKDQSIDQAIETVLQRLDAQQAELNRLLRAKADPAGAASVDAPSEAPPLDPANAAPPASPSTADVPPPESPAASHPEVAAAPSPGILAAPRPQAAIAPRPDVPAAPRREVAVAPRPDVAPRLEPSAPAAALVSRGQELIEAGDIAGARLMFERAAIARDPDALTALARTYDPDVLSRMRVRGVRPDRSKADAFYREAQSARASAATGAIKP